MLRRKAVPFPDFIISQLVAMDQWTLVYGKPLLLLLLFVSIHFALHCIKCTSNHNYVVHTEMHGTVHVVECDSPYCAWRSIKMTKIDVCCVHKL